MSIFRHGIRSVLPETITLLSGPGCPVCVTAQKDIDAFVKFAGLEDVIVTTFGDLIKVPGSDSSLGRQKAEGADVRIVYSVFDAVEIAKSNGTSRLCFVPLALKQQFQQLQQAYSWQLKQDLTIFPYILPPS